MMDNAISLMIAIPLLAAVLAFLNAKGAKYLALIGSLIPLGISLQMFQEFDKASNAMQFVESYDWVPAIGVKYTVGYKFGKVIRYGCLGCYWKNGNNFWFTHFNCFRYCPVCRHNLNHTIPSPF